MTLKQIESLILEVINKYKNQEGLTPFMVITAYIRSKGVKIENEQAFLASFEYLLDSIPGHNNTLLVRLKTEVESNILNNSATQNQNSEKDQIVPTSTRPSDLSPEKRRETAKRNDPPSNAPIRNVQRLGSNRETTGSWKKGGGRIANNPRAALSDWAYIPDQVEMFERLFEITLPETWHYGTRSQPDKYPILASYLYYTFFRLQQEGGKIVTQGDYATFNTGLVDKRYEPIYALFTKNASFSTRPWKFLDFCIAGEERSGKSLVKNFNPLPKRANYFDKVSDMLYDVTSGAPKVDYQHIIVENTMRLPYDFLLENLPKGFETQDIGKKGFGQKKEYFKKLGKAIEGDNKVYRFIKSRLDDAIQLGLKRVEWNFKTAIPMYFPTRNVMSLLLPLALMDEERVDAALVVEKTPSGSYLGHTILPLDLAYSNARLVCRPDSDWLVAEKIQNEQDDTDVELDNDL